MAGWFQKLKQSVRGLVQHQKSKLHGGEIVETLGSIRGEIKGLGLNCKPTGRIEVHRVRGGDRGARVALAVEQVVEFGRGDSAIVVSLTESEVRALIAMLNRTGADDGAGTLLDRPQSAV